MADRNKDTKANIEEHLSVTDRIEAAVKRGPESWAFIYVTLGFALTIETSLIQMTPLHFPFNWIVYGVVAAITFWLFMDNAWVQNRLMALKIKFESKFR